MYTQFFRLNQAPFSIAPDPRYLFMSERHREALAHLLYGVDSGGGFVLLTGEIGAGKTTVCRCFLEQIPANCNVAYIFNPKLTVNELLKSICDEFHIEFRHQGPDAATVKDYVDALNIYLLATHAGGKNNVLIIDEAQNLSADVLEQLRLLTNLETNERKLLQVILIGQPELRAMLARPEMEQLAQRVIARYHLDSLSVQETARYILHRLAVAGLVGKSPFQQKSMQSIHQLAQGVPRRINLLCDRALLGAYAEGRQEVDRNIVKKAASEVFGRRQGTEPIRTQRWRHAWLGLMAGAAVAVATVWAMGNGWQTITAALSKSASPMAASSTAPIRTGKKFSGTDASIQKASSLQVPAGAASGQVSNAVPVPAASPAVSDLNTIFNSNSQDEHAAYRELAQLWGITLPDGEPCAVAQQKNVYCYKSGSGLAEIRQLDRPAILALRDDADKIHYAILTGLTNASATLRIGGASQTVSLIVLGRRFKGDFATFWRAPQSYCGKIAYGDRGEEIDWLAAQLAKLAGTQAPVPNQPLGPAVIKQVREFQSVQGLEVDGIVGPKTFMHLNNAAGIAEPRLKSSAAVVNPGVR